MAKGKNLNPADAFRKAQRKKELKKNKADRTKTKDFALVKKDTNELEDEIAKIESSADASAEDKSRLADLKKELETIMKKKEDYVTEHPEQRRLVYRGRKTDAPQGEKSGEAPKPQTKRNVFDKNGMPRHPERSIYYDPVLNPYGVAPPGMPYMERALLPGEGSDEDDDAFDSDDDIAMPAGPPPVPEDDDDDIPMPEGPPLPPGPPPPDALMAHMIPGLAPQPSVPVMPVGVPPPPPGFSAAPGLSGMPPPPPGFPAGPGFAGVPPPPPGVPPFPQAGFVPPPPPGFPAHFGGVPPPPPSFPGMFAGMPAGMPPPPPPPPGFPVHYGGVPPPPPGFPAMSVSMPPQPPLPAAPPGFYPRRGAAAVQHTTVRAPTLPAAHASLPAKPAPPPPPTIGSAAAAAATVEAAPELRDFKKEATAFVPAALRKKKAAAAAAPTALVPDAVPIDAAPGGEETKREERVDLVGMLKQQLGSA